ncbi:hypothetical protein IEQ34_012656 [Dendrobium chrysotoxum]|uniref:Uncharacterized protein n=1 Tax=Dendrobium chrysotoxum TaxID=161865 RepID=A0AAV7GMH1_DENCH|nr:hypothetical protein IEQ34_012656 [Dendrobium chrysotoxum]
MAGQKSGISRWLGRSPATTDESLTMDEILTLGRSSATGANWIILFKFSNEDPPSSIAFLAFFANSFALFRLSSPSSPPVITFSTTFLTSSPFTNASSLMSSTKKIGTFAPTATPILKTSTTNLSFTNWSPNLGHVAITTPAAIASNVEFHPQ